MLVLYISQCFQLDVLFNVTLLPHAEMLQSWYHKSPQSSSIYALFHDALESLSLDHLALHRRLDVLLEHVAVALENSGGLLVQWIGSVWLEEEELLCEVRSCRRG